MPLRRNSTKSETQPTEAEVAATVAKSAKLVKNADPVTPTATPRKRVASKATETKKATEKTVVVTPKAPKATEPEVTYVKGARPLTEAEKVVLKKVLRGTKGAVASYTPTGWLTTKFVKEAGDYITSDGLWIMRQVKNVATSGASRWTLSAISADGENATEKAETFGSYWLALESLPNGKAKPQASKSA